MRIALVTPNFPPHFEGGTERVARAQANALRALGHDVQVVSGTDHPYAGDDREVSEVDGFQVVHLPRFEDEVNNLDLDRPRLAGLALELTREADVVHVHSWANLSTYLVRALAPEVPVVVTFHDFFSTCPRFFRSPGFDDIVCPGRGEFAPCVRCVAPLIPPEIAPARVALALDGRAAAFEAEARAASALIAPSSTHARDIEELLGLEPRSVRVLPHGLCGDLTRPDRADTWDGSRPLAILHMGHRAHAKGTLDLVHALAELPPGAVELHLAGREVEPGMDEELTSAARGVVIVQHGSYEGEALSSVAARCDMAAFPSRARESYGLVVEEALALGLPAWVSDRGALREHLEAHPGAGRVLPACNPEAWTRAVLELLDDPRVHARERAAIPASFPAATEAARELDLLYKNLLTSAST